MINRMTLQSVSSLRLISNRRIQSAIQSNVQSRTFHITSSAKAISNFTMPAMSPTMTEGGVASWKVKDGQSFSAGDVLLEIETDKATMDVEAQEDGVMGKIIVQDGAKEVAVGKTIALLAEEGDDISNLEVPSEESSSSKPSSSSSDNKSSSSSASSSSPPSDPPATKSTPSPTSNSTPSPSNSNSSSSHSHSSGPMFPSVSRLLSENNVSSKDSEKIKGTGVRGMLTKGDVLTYLGVVERPTGSFKEVKHGISALGGGAPTGSGKGGKPGEVKSEPLTPSTLRSLILSGLSSSSSSARSRLAAQSPMKPTSSSRSSSGIDELISDYEFGSTKNSSSSVSKGKKDSFEGLF